MKGNKLFIFIILLVFAISFSIPSIFLITGIVEHKEAKKLVETGTSISALPTNYGSNLTVNNINYYYIEYEYIVDGVTHYGKTSSKYTNYEYYEYFKQGEILIKYNKDFKSIEADYSLTTALKSELIMFSIFAIVDLGFWIAIVCFVIQIIKYGILNFLGKSTDANFISIKPGIIVNDVPMYKINYCWRNNIGEICEDTSGSDYTLTQARAFEICGKFKILTYKNLSRIVSKPSKLIFQQAEKEHLSYDDYVICEYCGSVYNGNNSRCSSCGAPKQKTSKPATIENSKQNVH